MRWYDVFLFNKNAIGKIVKWVQMSPVFHTDIPDTVLKR